MSDTNISQPGKSELFRTAVAYVAMIVATVVAFLLIRAQGETLPAPESAADAAQVSSAAKSDLLFHVLLALVAVIVVGQVLSRLFRFLGQPPVIGEVTAGILLGPSLLGPDASAAILPQAIAPTLGVVAQLGVILYMFLVGLELNADLLKNRAHAVVAVSHASIVVPFLLGALLALFLFPRLSSSDSFTSFALFLGVAMSITAFPVLARILTDRGLTHTELGAVAMSCAASDDVTAWCLLAFVVGVARSEVTDGLIVTGGALLYVAAMFLIVRPIAARLALRWPDDRLPRGAVGLVFIALLLSALATEGLGIHALFGAFLLGAVIPHDSPVARALTRQLEPVVTVLLLPAFFAFTGMRTRIDLVAGWESWLICGVIILVATLGKFGGTLVAARLTGSPWRQAAALGVLMNTRGLMELIVLNIGLDLGVISPPLFAMMVLMALATTMMTSPILARLAPTT